MWLTLLNLLLTLAVSIAQAAGSRQLLAAGAAQQVVRDLQHAQEQVQRAHAARSGVSHDDDSILHDPDNRDNR